jgi:hypothetical protein
MRRRGPSHLPVERRAHLNGEAGHELHSQLDRGRGGESFRVRPKAGLTDLEH